MHIIFDCKFLDNRPKKEFNGDSPLVYEWKKASGDPEYVHVWVSNIMRNRSQYNKKSMLNYILKYVGKGSELDDLEGSVEYFEATFGKRMVTSGGTLYKTRRFIIKKNLDKSVCKCCGVPFQYVSDYEILHYSENNLYKPPPIFGEDSFKGNHVLSSS